MHSNKTERLDLSSKETRLRFIFAIVVMMLSGAAAANGQGVKLSSSVTLAASPNPSQSGQAVTLTAIVSTQSGPLTGATYASQLVLLGQQVYVPSQQPWNLQGAGTIENYDPTKDTTVRLYAASFGIDYDSPLVLALNPNPTPHVDFDLASGEMLASSPCCTSPSPVTATFPSEGTNITSITASGYGAPLISTDCAYPTNCPIQPGLLYLVVSVIPPVTGSFSGATLWLQYPAPANGPPPIDPSLGTLALLDGSTQLTRLDFTDDGTGKVTFSTSNLSVGSHTIQAVYSGNKNFDGSTSTVTQIVIAAPAPLLTVSPTTLTFAYQTGGQHPDSQFVTLLSANISALNFAIASNETWLAASPKAGSTTSNVSISVDPTGLKVGSYQGALTITGVGASNSPQTVSVQLNIVGATASIGALANAASYGTPASGGAASIFGLFPGVPTTTAASTPLPTSLGNVTVFIDNVQTPLYYVSPTQINVQIPWEVGNDPNATMSVTNGIWNTQGNASIQTSSPGIFEIDAKHDAALLHSDYTLVTAAHPAVPGETILVFATGLGPVSPTQLDGTAASNTVLANTITTPKVKIGSQITSVSFSGLAPGFVGLYQINTLVPSVNAGDNPITLTINGSASNSAMIVIAPEP